MARRGIFGGLLTITTAAAAVAGVCYLFKDEIKGTKTYKDLDEKYDVDKKIKEYSEKAKTKAYDLKDKTKTAAKDIKSKVDEWKASDDDDLFDDDEIIIDDGDVAENRDYVSIKEDIEEKAEDIKEEAQEKAEDIKEEVKDKADDIKDIVSDKLDDIKDISDNIELD